MPSCGALQQSVALGRCSLGPPRVSASAARVPRRGPAKKPALPQDRQRVAGPSAPATPATQLDWQTERQEAEGAAQLLETSSEQEADFDQRPVTAATEAARATTAHAAARQAASAAQESSVGSQGGAAGGSAPPSPRALRDAFSQRDAFTPRDTFSPGLPPQPANGSSAGDSRLRSHAQATTSSPVAPPSFLADLHDSAADSSDALSDGYGSGSDAIGHGQDFAELLGPAENHIGPRARSASDANVLRRKGHLKEQDSFISFLLRMHEMHSCLEVMQKMERWITEHRREPRGSQLSRMVSSVGSFFTPLKLVDAFLEYDEFFALSRRKYVPPNFAEIRHVLNIAQVHASASTLQLVTFDADGTLYADGAHMAQDNRMISHIIDLLKCNVHVAIVTAAGYPGDALRFEQRVAGLLAAFRAQRLPDTITNRFHIVGGECNYLLRVGSAPERRLEFVPDEQWKSDYMLSWREEDIKTVLDEAGALLQATAAHLRLPVSLVRKERSVGVIPTVPTIYEVLEELAITVQAQLADRLPLPFCAFNGGADVFVDLGNKSLGLEAIMNYLGTRPQRALHVGDRFTASGNDVATRDCCCILWVANPDETCYFVKLLLNDIFMLRNTPYIE